MTLRTALAQGTALLEEAAIPVPRLTAEVLLAHALQRDRVYLFAHADDELSQIGWIHYGRYLHQRLKGVPTQYITRRQEFYGREFRVSPAVLIPRPETEHAVEAVLARVRPGDLVVDVGTGSGAIAVTVALEAQVRVTATDISPDALQVARCNAGKLGARVHFVQCDLASAVRTADMVVSNPPYVGLCEAAGLQQEVRDHEPHLALFAGEDGTVIYRRLIAQARELLTPGGWIVLELGWRSLAPVTEMLAGWNEVTTVDDLAGIPRVIAARRPA